MAGLSIHKYQSAAELPIGWDGLASCIFQQRQFLLYSEKYNPCKQRYYLLSRYGECLAAACVYTLGISLFTFRNIPSRVSMQVIGLPASVSVPGMFGKSFEDQASLTRYIFREEKGFILGLNLEPASDYSPAIMMEMMPTVEFGIKYTDWNDYISRLRSDYRRRTMKILGQFKEVKEVRRGCSYFTEKHYSLYRQVIKHSTTRLEILSLEFFQNLSEAFFLTTYYYRDQILCWHICCVDGDTLYFFFGGHDYSLLDTYRSYFNNLFGIMREAFQMGCHKIDFGQTAESAKLRTGGVLKPRQLFLYSRFPLIRMLISLCKPFLAYKTPEQEYRLFRGSQANTKTIGHENPIRKTSTAEGNDRPSAYHDSGTFGIGSAGSAYGAGR